MRKKGKKISRMTTGCLHRYFWGCRQKDAHAHAVIPWRDSPHFVYVVDLGSDKIYHCAHNEDDATGNFFQVKTYRK
jgi:6-phosphogluconolactonase (cycloisomerase 2 family)